MQWKILGSDLFWGRRGGDKRKEFLPQAVSSRSCDPLDIWLGDTFSPPWIIGFQGNWLVSEAKDDVSCYHLVYEETL